MKHARLIVILIALGVVSVRADQTSDVVRQIAEAQGMRSLVDGLLVSAKANAEVVRKKMFADMAARLGVFSPAQQKKVDAAGARFQQAVMEALDAERFVSSWVEEYSKHVNLPQAQAILAFYQSDAGKIDVAASKQSAMELQKYFQSLIGEKMRLGAANYVEELKNIARSPE